ncbi:hypothetical protein BJ742DRAFT_270000 [Cladochytrium replicatum]|nr:hypothetical protein BJ742DRAFT_270000 [Cladochytrium replicatum]
MERRANVAAATAEEIIHGRKVDRIGAKTEHPRELFVKKEYVGKPANHQVELDSLRKATELHQCTPFLRADQVSVLSRRKDLASTFTASHSKVKVEWGWDDPQFLAQFTVVMILCSTMHLSLVNELIRTQEMPAHLLFINATPMVTTQRLRNICKTELVLQPAWDSILVKKSSQQKVNVLFFVAT